MSYKRARDTYRTRAYRWEAPYVNTLGPRPGDEMSIDECAALAAKAANCFGVRAPRIKDGRGCRSARGGAFALTLPRWSRTPGIVLHEAAHSIVENIYGSYRKVAWHGKEWVGVYMYLLAKFEGRDIGEMTDRANEMGLPFISRNSVLELIRERKKKAA